MAEEIRLVGNFTDNITPQLRKLSRELNNVSKSFTKIQKKLRPITKEMGNLAMASERVAEALKEQKNAIDQNSRSWKQYQVAVGKAGAAQRKAFKGTARGGRGPSPISGSRRSRDAGGGREPLGIGGMTAAVFAGQAAFGLAASAFYNLTNSVRGAVAAGSQAEQAVINMAGTLQTLGKIGDYQASAKIATGMMKDLAVIAAALPGATGDYLTILQQTLDDQIQAYGSADKVRANLAKGERSFTALFGMSAQIAGLRPALAAMDINQLRANPRNIRQIQLLTRNPTLQKYYLEELEKTGGNFFEALDRAMRKAITPEQIEALKKSFDSASQTFITSFNDAYSGVFGAMREISLITKDGRIFNTTAIKELGKTLKIVNDIFDDVWSTISGTDFDPMVSFANALRRLQGYFSEISKISDQLASGQIDFGTFVTLISEAIGEAFGGFIRWVSNLDYSQFFQLVDSLVAGFFSGLFKGLRGGEGMGKGILTAFGTSITGTITVIGLFVIAINKATAALNGLAMSRGTGGGAGAPGRRARSADRRGLRRGTFTERQQARTRGGLRRVGRGVSRIGGRALRGVANFGRGIPGGAILAGAADMGIAIATGENLGKAAAGTIGSVLGAGIGTIFGPAGTIIGGIAGGYLGDLVYNAFDPAAETNLIASENMKEAAKIQKELADKGAGGAQTLARGVVSPEALRQVLISLGRDETELGQFVIDAASKASSANTKLDEATQGMKDLLSSLKKVGMTETDIMNLPAYKAFQASADAATKDLTKYSDLLGQAYAKYPQEVQTAIAERLNTMTTARITASNVQLFGPGVTKPNGGSQFTGGSVLSSRSYMVGERGPELFTPNSSGKITPNNELGGGFSMSNVTINVNGVNDPEAIGNEVADQILTAFRKATYSELELT